MTITIDAFLKPFIKREGYTAAGGALEYEERLAPAILPMTAFELLDIEPLQWVVSTKTRTGAITKGEFYAVRAITNKGLVVLEDREGKPVPGLFPMDYFARMIREEGTFVAHNTTAPNPDADGGRPAAQGRRKNTADQP